MAEFDDKLNAILSNPEIMGQIMSMAGAMNQSQSPPPPQKPGPGMGIDPAMLTGMMDMMRSTQIDPRQQNLIRALHGFVPDDRLQKLEKAMQAAKIARFASTALGGNFSGGR